MLFRLLLLPCTLAIATQLPLPIPAPPNPDREQPAIHPTLISLLSTSPNHTTLLHLLQRTRLVPVLNHIVEGTLFAPTDDAWARWAAQQGYSLDSLLSTSAEELADNILFPLRQHLFYHILNHTLPSSHSSIETHETLLYPSRPLLAPSPNPPTGLPWIPQAGYGDLGGEGQRVRVDFGGRRVGVEWDGSEGVGVWDDWVAPEPAGEGGVGGWEAGKGGKDKPWFLQAGNGIIIGLSDVLPQPPSLPDLISSHPNLTYLTSLLPLLPPSFPSLHHPALTVFAPTDEAFGVFGEEERRYLASEFGGEGVGRILGGHVAELGKKGLRGEKEEEGDGLGKETGRVGWRSYWAREEREGSGEVTLLDNSTHPIRISSNGSMSISSHPITHPDILASNGVLHLTSTLLLPPSFTLLNSAEKKLIALNATRFVGLLRTANLSDLYVGENPGEGGWTILAPSDEALDRAERERYFSSQQGVGLEETLKYHIIPGKLPPKALQDQMLVETELKTERLGGGRQVVKVSLGGEGLGEREREEGEGVRWGRGVVIGKPVHVGESIIYLISTLLEPPSDIIQTAVTDLSLSTSLATIFASSLDLYIRRTPSLTLFLPTNRAFSDLGVAMGWFLSEAGKDDLRRLVKGHIISGARGAGVGYLKRLEEGRGGEGERVWETIGGEGLAIHGTGGLNGSTGNLTVHAPFRKVVVGNDVLRLPGNGAPLPAQLKYGDLLTDSGVIHVLDSVVIPGGLNLTIGKLVKGMGNSGVMVDLLEKAGMEWVLHGREPRPEEVEKLGLGLGAEGMWFGKKTGREIGQRNGTWMAGDSYTLLCPDDKAFSNLNLTYYLHNEPALLNLLKLHIIPSRALLAYQTNAGDSPIPAPKPGHPITLDNEVVYPTLLSAESQYGNLVIRANGDNGWLVGVANARGAAGQTDVAKVVSRGRGSVRWVRVEGEEGNSTDVGVLGGRSWWDDQETEEEEYEPKTDAALLWNGVMTLGGGVIGINAVLLPYEPSWVMKWGGLVIGLTLVGMISLGLVGFVVWWWRGRKARREALGTYEPLEGEEDY